MSIYNSPTVRLMHTKLGFPATGHACEKMFEAVLILKCHMGLTCCTLGEFFLFFSFKKLNIGETVKSEALEWLKSVEERKEELMRDNYWHFGMCQPVVCQIEFFILFHTGQK